jgi:plastocyanin
MLMSHSVARLLRPLAAVALGAACAAPVAAAPRLFTVLDGDGKPLADAVVAVLPRGARSTAVPGAQAELAQRNRSFDPSLLVVQAGTAVNFPNFDTVRHHVYSFSPAKTFELKLYSGTPAQPVVFDKPGVAVLGCNIHDRMAAWVVVVDTPLHAKTDTAGRAELDLPDGEHRVQLWHTSLRDALQEQPLKLDATARELRLAVARP